MSPLLDEFRSVLGSFRDHLSSLVNQGLVVSVEDHIARLEAVAPEVEQTARNAVHEILTELYSAWHGPAQDTPAPAPAPDPAAAAPVDAEPVLATGGLVSGPGTVVVGESGPETLTIPDGAAVADPVPAAVEPVADPAPAETPAVDGPADPATSES